MKVEKLLNSVSSLCNQFNVCAFTKVVATCRNKNSTIYNQLAQPLTSRITTKLDAELELELISDPISQLIIATQSTSPVNATAANIGAAELELNLTANKLHSKFFLSVAVPPASTTWRRRKLLDTPAAVH